MKNRAFLICFICCVYALSVGCPATSNKEIKQEKVADVPQKPKSEQPPAKSLTDAERRKLILNPLEPLPQNIETIKISKDQDDFHLYLHPGGLLRKKALEGKDGHWLPKIIPFNGHRSWFVRIEPEKGASLGTYTVIHTILAIYSSAGGTSATSRMSVRFLLRRGKREQELFRTMIIARGREFRFYVVQNREIASNTPLQSGDIFIFRLYHRSGNNGAMGLRGTQGSHGPQIVISHRQISDYYRYTGGDDTGQKDKRLMKDIKKALPRGNR
jgi:hypothetical protein